MCICIKVNSFQYFNSTQVEKSTIANLKQLKIKIKMHLRANTIKWTQYSFFHCHGIPGLTMGEDGLCSTMVSVSRLLSILSCSWWSKAKPAAMSLGTRSVSCKTHSQLCHSSVLNLLYILNWSSVLTQFVQIKKNVGIAYREELAKELGNAWKCSTATFILWQAAAQQPQSALPHFDSEGASRGEELGAPVVLHVPYAKWLHCRWLRTGVAQWVKHKQHAQRRKQQNDPADVRTKVKKCSLNHYYLLDNKAITLELNLPGNHCRNDSTNGGRIAATAVVRYPHSSQTGPHQFRDVEDSPQVH